MPKEATSGKRSKKSTPELRDINQKSRTMRMRKDCGNLTVNDSENPDHMEDYYHEHFNSTQAPVQISIRDLIRLLPTESRNEQFEAVLSGDSGFMVKEDSRQLAVIQTDLGKMLIVANNNGRLMFFKINFASNYP